MNNRSRFPLALAAACAVAPVSAFDFGVYLLNESAVSGSGTQVDLTQENQAVAWISLPAGASSSFYASALYEFYGDYTLRPAYSSAIRPFQFTAGRIEWEGFAALGSGASLAWSAGRIPLRDYSGRIVSGLFDGARVELSVGSIQTKASVAYTGLTFKDEALVIIDVDDEERWNDVEEAFAPGRLVASFGARFVELVPRHDFGLDGWAQFDLDQAGSVDTDTQYVEPFVEGRLGRLLRWRLWGAAGLGQDPGFFYSLAGGASLRLSVPEILGLQVATTAAWAGGDYDADGAMRAFKPVTSGSLTTVGTVAFSDALGASLDASVSLPPGLSLGTACAAAFTPSAAGSSWYRGFEVSGRLSYRPFNDVSVSASGGAFLPDAATASGPDAQWSATVSALLSL